MAYDPPVALAEAVAQETSGHARDRLRAAAAGLSERYRTGVAIPATLTAEERAAYLAVRFPSTYAIAAAVWRHVSERLGGLAFATVLDAGAGPGTASLALQAVAAPCPTTLLERDPGWRSAALKLAGSLGTDARFVQGDLGVLGNLPGHDAVVASHVLNELPASARTDATLQLWGRAQGLLVIIEPGTPAGFEAIRSVRQAVLDRGGHIVAPCTHDLGCPVTGDDWCHFDVQIERSALHRAVKSGSLSHETGKFSYVAISRREVGPAPGGRIVRRPIRGSGHVHFDVCASGTIERVTVSKRHGAAWRTARDLSWGEILEP
jgi:ribosomal protein RSM22 (predicted rRNA methylase)